MTQLKGIDVSKFQGTIDWKKVDASGIDFVLIRAGFGNEISQRDLNFEENVKGALANDLHVGAYWFSYAISPEDARKEADVFKKVLAPYKGKLDFPVAFDYEYDSMEYSKKQGVNPTNALIDSIAHAFMDSMKADGWFVNLYTNCDFIRSGRFTTSTIKAYDLWLADYTGAPDYPCGIQQTGSQGTLPGISGNVDMDVAFKDYPTIIKAGGYNGYPKPVDFKCDTSCDMTLTRGQAYEFKVTSPKPPSAGAGVPGVAAVLPMYRSGNNSYFYVVGFGNSGASTGIYVNGVRQFIVHIK